MPSRRTGSLVLALAVTVVAGAATLKVGPGLVHRFVAWRGLEMNRAAWEEAYIERDLPVPPGGPRDGYWGSRIGASVPDSLVGWILPELAFPGTLMVAEDGSQTVGNPADSSAISILILGASTAFGSYASDEGHTYFVHLSRALERDGVPNWMRVLATGAWKSQQEVAALQRALAEDARPHVVLFVNGLNDLTNGSNASTLFGAETLDESGELRPLLYNERDYEARVALYLENMSRARTLLSGGGALMIVLQPALFEKEPLSGRERDLLEASLQPLGPPGPLEDSYQRMREGLQALATWPNVMFVDCSRAFDGEEETTFTDLWHFPDPGHEALADCIAPDLTRLARRLHPGPDAPRPVANRGNDRW